MSFFRKLVYDRVSERRSSSDSESLLKGDQKDLELEDLPEYRQSNPRFNCWTLLKTLHVLLTIALAFFAVKGSIDAKRLAHMNPQLVYSPAQDAVKYVAKTFTSSLDYGKTIYQGKPSEKNNEAWSELILRGLTRITAEEAAPMHNRTMPIPDDPEHYIISLAVFHQLYCLNAIRFSIWNQTMDAEKERQHHETAIRHLDHCVDLIRQALMCAADISPFVWARDPRGGKLHGISSVAHTCRDWDAIMDCRPIVTGFNVTKPIEHDPLGWGDSQYVMDYGEIKEWEEQKPDYDAWVRGKIHEQHLRGPVGYEDLTNYP